MSGEGIHQPIVASRLHVSLALAIQLIVLISAGYALVARIDERLANVEETVRPLSDTLVEMGRLQERVEVQKEEIRVLERDIRLNERTIQDIEVELGVQSRLERSTNP